MSAALLTRGLSVVDGDDLNPQRLPPIGKGKIDSYVPLDCTSAVVARENIRTYTERLECIYLDRHYKGGTIYKGFKDRKGRRIVRCLYNFLTGYGSLPQAWSKITGSAASMIAITVTASLSQLEVVSEGYLNDAVSVDLAHWIVSFSETIAFALVVLIIVFFVDRISTSYRTSVELHHEARFDNIMKFYEAYDPYIENYRLEYVAAEDPDIAMMYFTLRQKRWNLEEGGVDSDKWGKSKSGKITPIPFAVLQHKLKRLFLVHEEFNGDNYRDYSPNRPTPLKSNCCFFL